MDYFFHHGELREAVSSWFDGQIPPKGHFVPYFDQDLGMNNVIPSGRKNVKMRIVEMVRKVAEARAVQNDKSTRHMLRERLRRQSHKDGYATLHALLPAGTKSDKISVITAATMEIIRTRRVLEELRRRNAELKRKLAAQVSDRVAQGECSSAGNDKMIRVEHPLSLVDALHCVKDAGMDIRRMRAQIDDQELLAEFEVDLQPCR